MAADLLKYAAEFEAAHPRVPTVEELDPNYRFTRLGAVLRQTAAEDSTIGHLARVAVTSHDLTPLFVLRDAVLDNPEHPIASRFNWERLPEKVAMDRSIPGVLADVNRKLPASVVYDIRPEDLKSVRFTGGFGNAVLNVFKRLQEMHPGTSNDDINDAAYRHQLKNARETAAQRVGNGRDVEAFHDTIADYPKYERYAATAERY